jgi:hypothetical protein
VKENNASLALTILDSLRPHTLNAIVSDLASAGNLAMLRAVREVKGIEFFMPKEGATLDRYKDPFVVAVKANRIEVVHELLSYGLAPAFRNTFGGKSEVFYVDALSAAVDAFVRAKTDQERADASMLGLTVYGAVKDALPHLFSLESHMSGIKKPGEVLGERQYTMPGEKEAPKRVKNESFLDVCVANDIAPLVEAVIAHIESIPTACFSSRTAELLVAKHDLTNFARLMAYAGEVDLFLMDKILKLPEPLQAQAMDAIKEHEIDPGIISKIEKYAATIAPSTMSLLLEKCAMDLTSAQVSALLVRATQADNVPLMRELISLGERTSSWSVNESGIYTVEGMGGTQMRRLYPIHECHSGDAVRLLVEHGADIETLDSEGATPLQAMVSTGRVDRNDRDERGRGVVSALFVAGAFARSRYKGRTITQLSTHRSAEVKAILRAGKTQVALDNSISAGVDDRAAVPRSRGPAAM